MKKTFFSLKKGPLGDSGGTVYASWGKWLDGRGMEGMERRGSRGDE
jgi:hypothetical protein